MVNVNQMIAVPILVIVKGHDAHKRVDNRYNKYWRTAQKNIRERAKAQRQKVTERADKQRRKRHKQINDNRRNAHARVRARFQGRRSNLIAQRKKLDQAVRNAYSRRL